MSGAKYREFLWIFLRIGNTTVGGGEPTMIALQRELDRRGWLTPDQFGIAYALARLTPGTNMLAFCAAAGYYMFGLAGAFGGVLAVTIPSSVLVIWLTSVCEAGNRIPLLGAAVGMTIAAVVGVMVAVAIRLAATQARGSRRVVGALIFLGAFLLRTAGLSPLQTLIAAAIAGLFWIEP